MVSNPIQGIVRGEAILDGDASGGIDLTLYAVTPGWGALSGVTVFRAGGAPSNYVAAVGTTPFKSAMVGKTITFARNGARIITTVLSSGEILVDSPVSFLVDETPTDDTFSMDAQEGLREVTLDADDELHITDVFISQEKDSEYALVAGEDVPGRRVAKGRLLEVGSINLRFNTPFVMQPNGALKYFGHDNGLNVCLISGHIT